MKPNWNKQLSTLYCYTFVYLLSFFLNPLIAQSTSYEFQLYDISNGLADNEVNKIAQDEKGFLWIATNNGLSRFDGNSFVNFSNFDSLQYIRRNRINDIFISKEQLLYLATDKGIDVFDPEQGLLSSILPSESKDKGLQGDFILSFWQDQQDRFWVSSNRKYAYQYSNDLINFSYGPPLKSPDAFDYNNHLIYEFLESDNKLYARASQNQIWKLNHQGAIVKRFSLEDLQREESLSSPYAMCFDSKGTLWSMFLENGLAYVDEGTEKIKRHPISDKIKEPWKTGISVDHENNLWMGGIDLLYKYYPDTDSLLILTESLKLLSDGVQLRIFDMFVDRQNHLWIGSNLGLIKVQEKKNIFTHFLPGQAVRALAESYDGTIFVGKYYSVELLDPTTGKVSPFPIKNYTENDKRIFLMDPTSLIVQDSSLWMRGVSNYNLSTGDYVERETASYFDYLSIIDHMGLNWVAGSKLLQVFDPEKETFVSVVPPKAILDIEQTDISCIYQTSDYKIWLATNRGLFFMDYSTKEFQLFEGAGNALVKKMIDTKTNALFEDTEHRLWAGTDGGGLFAINIESGQVEKFSRVNGLPSNYLYGILPEADSCLWFSTGSGLSRFHLGSALFSNYNEDDGLMNNAYQKYSFLKSRDGRMYFGGNKGIDAFYPKQISNQYENSKETEIVLTRFSKYSSRLNKKIDHIFHLSDLKRIDLEYYERDLVIEFSLQDLASPDKHRYSWRLLGYADEWSEPILENNINFESLPPGSYTFEVRASTGKANWNKEYLRIQIVKKQVWYKSPWFFLLLGILFGGFVFLYQRNRYLEKIKVKEQTELLRTKISHDLHDDVGGLLTGLTMQSELLEMTAQGKSKETASKIKNLGREALSRMRDTVWAMDANKDDVQSLFDRMKDHAELTLSAGEITYDFDMSLHKAKQILPPNIRQQTYLIYKEAITNVAKHSSGSWVKINVKLGASELQMRIIDNGEVLDIKTSGVGLESMRERARAVNGNLEIHSNNGFTILFDVAW